MQRIDQAEKKINVNQVSVQESQISQDTQESKKPSEKKKQQKKIKDYWISLDRMVGKGAFSKVYWAENKVTKMQYAVKEIPNQVLFQQLGDKGQKALADEVQISQMLKHKNIVRLYDYLRTENNNYLIFEYCEGGDLRTFLKEQQNSRFSEFTVQKFTKQLADALKHLYQHNIIHRDLKPQNILLTEKSLTATIKLADFGLARRYQSEEDLFETTCGTPIYMAPEIQKGESYTDKADLWSVGVILFELVAGFPPFGGRNKMELRQNIEKGVFKLPPDVQVSKICIHLIISLLQADASNRLPWQEFFDHPFVRSDEKTYAQLYEFANDPKKTNDDNQQQNQSSPREQIVPQVAKKPLVNNRYKEEIKQEVIILVNNSPKDQQKPSPDQIQKDIKEINSKDKYKSTDNLCGLKLQPNHNSDSLTQEDLDEAIDDIAASFDILVQRVEQAIKLIQSEVKQKLTQEPYLYEKESKFIIYRLTLELKTAFEIFCTQDFIGSLSINRQGQNGQNFIVQKINNLKKKYERQEGDFSLRVFTSQPKEIKFTSFLLQRLSEKHGDKMIIKLENCFDYYLQLNNYVIDIGYLIEQYDLNSLSKDILNYAIELCKQGASLESLYEYNDAKQKYQNSQFVIEELERELYHSLKFSNEEAILSADDSSQQQKNAEIIAQQNQRKVESKVSPNMRKIKSFTFDKSHMKISFAREDELIMNEILKLLDKRILSSDKNILISENSS